MNEKMMKNEVKYLREHLREIHQYKSSMKDLTYDMPLELLSRCCIAFDYLQQELQRKDNNWNELKKYIKNIDDNENSFGDYEIDYRTKQELLYKIKELEENK